jgi:hypothetical protein
MFIPLFRVYDSMRVQYSQAPLACFCQEVLDRQKSTRFSDRCQHDCSERTDAFPQALWGIKSAERRRETSGFSLTAVNGYDILNVVYYRLFSGITREKRW